jgi:hypothetical protein
MEVSGFMPKGVNKREKRALVKVKVKVKVPL